MVSSPPDPLLHFGIEALVGLECREISSGEMLVTCVCMCLCMCVCVCVCVCVCACVVVWLCVSVCVCVSCVHASHYICKIEYHD